MRNKSSINVGAIWLGPAGCSSAMVTNGMTRRWEDRKAEVKSLTSCVWCQASLLRSAASSIQFVGMGEGECWRLGQGQQKTCIKGMNTGFLKCVTDWTHSDHGIGNSPVSCRLWGGSQVPRKQNLNSHKDTELGLPLSFQQGPERALCQPYS